jgi:hypothetical protein
MGTVFTDKYSLLHFATGVVVYYWGMSLTAWIIIHIIYEYVENTQLGIKIINKITLWPGGKDKPDMLINRIGDIFYGLLGWAVANLCCAL